MKRTMCILLLAYQISFKNKENIRSFRYFICAENKNKLSIKF